MKILFLFLMINVSPAFAGLIVLGDFSGNENLIDFGNGPIAFFPKPYTLSGVTFDEIGVLSDFFTANRASNFDNIPGASLGNSLNTRASFSTVTVDFNSNIVTRAGLLVSAFSGILASFRFTAFDTNNNQLGLYELSQLNQEDALFMGWESVDGIGSISIQKFNGDPGTIWVLDDVRFENANATVPAPAPIWLLLFGLIGLFKNKIIGGYSRFALLNDKMQPT